MPVTAVRARDLDQASKADEILALLTLAAICKVTSDVCEFANSPRNR
jgi:hypothetical protein